MLAIGRSGRRAAVLLLLVASAATSPLPAREGEASVLPRNVLLPLTQVARELSKIRLTEEAETVLAFLEGAGWSEKGMASLRKDCAKRAERGGGANERAIGKIVSSLEQAARGIEAHLPEIQPVSERRRLASLLLGLDHEREEAYRALGFERVEGRWTSPEEIARLPRRAAFQDALRRARDIPVEVRSIPPSDLLEEVTGVKGRALRHDRFELHATRSRAWLERVVVEGVRASAVCGFLLTGRVAHPRDLSTKGLLPERTILLGNKAEYLRALEGARKRGWMTDAELDVAKGLDAFPIQRAELSIYLSHGAWQLRHTAQVVQSFSCGFACRRLEDYDGCFWFAQPCLQAGLINLACMAYLGTRLPAYMHSDPNFTKGTSRGDSWLRWMLPRTGLVGYRRRIVQLAREGRDPPWFQSMQDEIGKIQCDDLWKATSMMEFLFERGDLMPLVHATWPKKKGVGGHYVVDVFERALKTKLDVLEAEWKTWLLAEDARPERLSLLTRLRGRMGPAKDVGTATGALARLNYLRKRAGLQAVKADEELSRGARLHAKYLRLNPEQLSEWPGAHEEYPDRPGFTSDGAWAGSQSVIAPGCNSPEEAMDAWMGTFYHRLPLLAPYLLGVGWALEDRIAVMDAGSLSAPPFEDATVVWPHDGMKGVPRSFAPELPSPVPGENQSEWGYPVTLLVSRMKEEKGLEVGLDLRRGAPDGPEVECHISTPEEPTNPALAPRNAWCLIPRKALDAKTTYVVTARIGAEKPRTFRFETGD